MKPATDKISARDWVRAPDTSLRVETADGSIIAWHNHFERADGYQGLVPVMPEVADSATVSVEAADRAKEAVMKNR